MELNGEKLKKEIGSRVAQLRESAGKKQGPVADYLSVAVTTYRTREQGIAFFPVPELIKLAEFFDVSLDYLLTGKEEHKKPLALESEAANDLLCLSEEVDLSEGAALLASLYGRMTAEDQRDILIRAMTKITKQLDEEQSKPSKEDVKNGIVKFKPRES